MADKTSEFGTGPGRTGYLRDLRPAERLRLERATIPTRPDDGFENALARELDMEKRTRTVDAGRKLT